jgi:ABC-type lipoprotein export system ATPase subunit
MDPERVPKSGLVSSEADTLSLPARETRAPADGARSNSHAPAPVQSVLEVRALCRTYGTDPPVRALRNVDLTVYQGESVAIVGPSGSGKSTLLNVLGCLDRQTSGTYHIDGIDAASLSDEERATLRATKIGFVFQTFHLLGHRTALENVMLADVYAGGNREDRRERAEKSLERVGMGHRRDFMPVKLSGGEQQRVAIARALLGRPSLLLCDEPTGNLDTVNTESVLSLFETLGREGLTLVLITHDTEVAAHAQRMVRIVDGQLTEVTA